MRNIGKINARHILAGVNFSLPRWHVVEVCLWLSLPTSFIYFYLHLSYRQSRVSSITHSSLPSYSPEKTSPTYQRSPESNPHQCYTPLITAFQPAYTLRRLATETGKVCLGVFPVATSVDTHNSSRWSFSVPTAASPSQGKNTWKGTYQAVSILLLPLHQLSPVDRKPWLTRRRHKCEASQVQRLPTLFCPEVSIIDGNTGCV